MVVPPSTYLRKKTTESGCVCTLLILNFLSTILEYETLTDEIPDSTILRSVFKLFFAAVIFFNPVWIIRRLYFTVTFTVSKEFNFSTKFTVVVVFCKSCANNDTTIGSFSLNITLVLKSL